MISAVGEAPDGRARAIRAASSFGSTPRASPPTVSAGVKGVVVEDRQAKQREVENAVRYSERRAATIVHMYAVHQHGA